MTPPLHLNAAALALAPALLATWLPSVLRYRRGAIAHAALFLSALFAMLLGWSLGRGADYTWIEPALYAASALAAAASFIICAVGIYDRKRSAWSALLATLAFIAGTIGGHPLLGFSVCIAGLVLAWTLRAADPTEAVDMVNVAAISAHNRTRRARSIPRKLIREGQLHFLPIYYFATLSDLAREGILNSGSYRFADHIYRMQPSGRGPLGRWIDRTFLMLPASQAFHRRYKHAQHAVHSALASFDSTERPLRVLAIPCGLPRDLTELAATLLREKPELLSRLEYHGMDIDPELLKLAAAFTENCGVLRFFRQGNALRADDYPQEGFHAIVSTGLGEFLNDPQLAVFYRHVHSALLPGGTFYTSATAYEKRSEALLRAFELNTHYRTAEQLAELLQPLGWSQLTFTKDITGLQTFVTAIK